jgi:hypothetical protein
MKSGYEILSSVYMNHLGAFLYPHRLFVAFYLAERNARKKEPFISSGVVLPIRAEFEGSDNITKAHAGRGKKDM